MKVGELRVARVLRFEKCSTHPADRLDFPVGDAFTIDEMVFGEPRDLVLLGARSLEGLNLRIDPVAKALRTRADYFGLRTGVDAREFCRTSRMVSDMLGIPVPPNKAIIGANAFSHSSGIHQDGFLKDALCYEIIKPEDVGAEGSKIVLTARSGRSALAHRFRKLGFDFTRNDVDKLYEQFLKVADSKKEVENEDLLAMARQFKPEAVTV